MQTTTQAKRASRTTRPKIVRSTGHRPVPPDENPDDNLGSNTTRDQLRRRVGELFPDCQEATPESDQVGGAVLWLIDLVAFEPDPSQREALAIEISREIYSRTQDCCEAMDRFAVKAGASLGEDRPAVTLA